MYTGGTIFVDHATGGSNPVSFISPAIEDNQAALHVAMANPPRLTVRNKHWNIKHHWFRSHLVILSELSEMLQLRGNLESGNCEQSERLASSRSTVRQMA